MSAVETFKTTLIATMREKNTPNAEELVISAVNRVLGRPNQNAGPANEREETLMKTLVTMLSRIPGSDFPATPILQNHRSPPDQSPTNNNGTQGISAQPLAKLAGEKPSVMRPSFSGQGQMRSNGSVPRPSMGTPGMNRTNSSSSANAPSRPNAASPAPVQGSPNGASTPNFEPAQLAGQKRPLEDADDMRDFKKLSTSGPPQLKT